MSSTRMISSVAYALDDRLSLANTASAVGLPRRSCLSRSVSMGEPISTRFDRRRNEGRCAVEVIALVPRATSRRRDRSCPALRAPVRRATTRTRRGPGGGPVRRRAREEDPPLLRPSSPAFEWETPFVRRATPAVHPSLRVLYGGRRITYVRLTRRANAVLTNPGRILTRAFRPCRRAYAMPRDPYEIRMAAPSNR